MLQLRRYGFIALLGLMGTACGQSKSEAKPKADFYEELARLNRVMQDIQGKYVEEVPADKLTEAALAGLRTVLDPHTAVLVPEDFTDLKVHTDGEFGGLGIQIGVRENVLTVISPIQGTPASKVGLQAGDQILKIDGVTTRGHTADDAVSKLRGVIGTKVTISVWRDGWDKAQDFTITRAKISIESVPYAGIVAPGVGYIQVTQFARNTAGDVEKALQQLKSQGMKKLILDLRFNPGGLLDQAVEMSELFLPQGSAVVSIRGRIEKTEFSSTRPPVYTGPMVVLVNEGSASASEIVSGALQDHDRALVLGKTSFGKGSVQNVFNLDRKGYGLKLTTAFYYLPQGRCINKPENSIGSMGRERDEEGHVVDTTAADTVNRKPYFTKSGRKVWGGGGISPDIEVEARKLDGVSSLLERNTLFFKYAVKLKTQIGAQNVSVNWQPNDAQIQGFIDFALADTSFAKAKLPSENLLDMMRTAIKREKAVGKDSSAFLQDPVVREIEALRGTLKIQRRMALDQDKEYIRLALARELVQAVHGEKPATAMRLRSDEQVLEAIRRLQDEAALSALLKPSSARQEK